MTNLLSSKHVYSCVYIWDSILVSHSQATMFNNIFCKSLGSFNRLSDERITFIDNSFLMSPINPKLK